ncbi:MAG: 7-carboxy-7-deazaguanine synthase QueE [Elusimicrobiaceae bacterium]|nr:7-carboxy-7-deazaguanine synthase QueE [Elusimicrobiaceae bacterium]
MRTLPASSANKYKVNEIFYSLEGEGLFSGCPAIFVRLAGCTMCCPWCDTKYAQKTNLNLTAEQIFKKIAVYPCKTVVLTGGEPTEQNLVPLLKLLKKNKYQIHLETNGANLIDTKLIDFCTLSPKAYINAKMLKKANAVKYITDTKTTLREIESLQEVLNKKTLFYLQPKNNSKENIKQCLKLIKQKPNLRLSVQLHKFLKIK